MWGDCNKVKSNNNPLDNCQRNGAACSTNQSTFHAVNNCEKYQHALFTRNWSQASQCFECRQTQRIWMIRKKQMSALSLLWPMQPTFTWILLSPSLMGSTTVLCVTVHWPGFQSLWTLLVMSLLFLILVEHPPCCMDCPNLSHVTVSLSSGVEALCQWCSNPLHDTNVLNTAAAHSSVTHWCVSLKWRPCSTQKNTSMATRFKNIVILFPSGVAFFTNGVTFRYKVDFPCGTWSQNGLNCVSHGDKWVRELESRIQMKTTRAAVVKTALVLSRLRYGT